MAKFTEEQLDFIAAAESNVAELIDLVANFSADNTGKAFSAEVMASGWIIKDLVAVESEVHEGDHYTYWTMDVIDPDTDTEVEIEYDTKNGLYDRGSVQDTHYIF